MKHLYGIIPTNPQIVLGPTITGVRGEELQLIAHNGISALVSDSVYAEYTGLYKPALVQMLAEHQQITELMLAQVSGLLPVKFGTLLQPEEIHTLLSQSHAELATALEKLTDKVEVEVVATWQPERVFAELAQDPTITQLRAAAVGKSGPELQQIQLFVGQLVKAGLDARKTGYQNQLLENLGNAAADLEINPIFNEQVVANVAFLLDREKQADFDEKLAHLDAQLDGQLNFKVVGPLPAYSFSTVEVVKISAEDVEWARELLEIGDTASADEIRNAYRHQARQHHPDVTPNEPTAQAQFTDINNAYQLLQHCYAVQVAAAQPMPPEQVFRCNLSPTLVANTLLVNICRSSHLAAS